MNFKFVTIRPDILFNRKASEAGYIPLSHWLGFKGVCLHVIVSFYNNSRPLNSYNPFLHLHKPMDSKNI